MRNAGLDETSTLNPLEWAMIALKADSADSAQQQLTQRLRHFVDINSLLIIGGAPLPGSFRPGNNLKFPEPHYIAGFTVSEEFTAFLHDPNRPAGDPMPKSFKLDGSPVFVWEGCNTIAQMRAHDQDYTRHYFEHGLKFGVLVPNIDASAGKFDCLMFDSRGSEREFQEFRRVNRYSLQLAFTWFGEAMRVRALRASNSPHLSIRQRDCLRWVAAGLNSSEISERLKISDATVNEHLNVARQKLGATNRIQACARAILSGELSQ